MAFSDYLSQVYFGNTLQAYLISLGIFIAVILFLKLFKYVVLVKLKELAKKTKTDIDDLFIEILSIIDFTFYVILSIFIATRFLELPDLFHKIEKYVLLILGIFYIVRAIAKVITFGEHVIVKRNKDEDDTIIHVMGTIIKVIIWIIAVLFLLQSFGVNITALAAGLGIGGLAIAFAMQNVLSDLFASFAIYLDKPFKKGDFIIIGTDMGTIKNIGIRSTRIVTLQGQELIVSNRELTSTRINNYKKMERRRIVFSFGVVYETSSAKLKAIPGIVKDIIKKIKITDIDRVHFKDFGAYSLNFEVVYYINSAEYNIYMDTQEDINLKIKQEFEKRKIEMAFPTQKIYLEK